MKKVPGLGVRFIVAVDEAMTLISREPELFQKVHRSLRRVLVRRFPYGIFYIVEPNAIAVLAVMHTARHPSKWKKSGRV